MIAPTPNATKHTAIFAPITSPKAIAGASFKVAAMVVASSSGSAPASNNASAKLLICKRTAASPKCLAKVSAPQTMAATPAIIANIHKAITDSPPRNYPSMKSAERTSRQFLGHSTLSVGQFL